MIPVFISFSSVIDSLKDIVIIVQKAGTNRMKPREQSFEKTSNKIRNCTLKNKQKQQLKERLRCK